MQERMTVVSFLKYNLLYILNRLASNGIVNLYLTEPSNLIHMNLASGYYVSI